MEKSEENEKKGDKRKDEGEGIKGQQNDIKKIRERK